MKTVLAGSLVLALGLAAMASTAPAQPRDPLRERAEAERVLRDLLDESQPFFIRDAGGSPRPNRVVGGQTRPHAHAPGVCRFDRYTIVALPELESPERPKGNGKVATIRELTAETRYLILSIEALPGPGVDAARVLRSWDERCAQANDYDLGLAFDTDNYGDPWLAGQFMAALPELLQSSKSKRRVDCAPRRCPDPDDIRQHFHISHVSGLDPGCDYGRQLNCIAVRVWGDENQAAYKAVVHYRFDDRRPVFTAIRLTPVAVINLANDVIE